MDTSATHSLYYIDMRFGSTRAIRRAHVFSHYL